MVYKMIVLLAIGMTACQKASEEEISSNDNIYKKEVSTDENQVELYK